MASSTSKGTPLPLISKPQNDESERAAEIPTSLFKLPSHASSVMGSGGASRVRPEDLIVVNGLGKGSSSVVVEVFAAAFLTSVNDRSKRHFAMKCIPKAKISRPSQLRRLTNEIAILTAVKPSRFLLRSHLAFQSPSHIFLLTDYLSGGDLFFRLDQLSGQGREGFPEHSARTILAEVALGIIHLHDLGYIHHNVRLENVMFDAQGHAKLIDFSLAERNAEHPKTIQGTVCYIAPELLSKRISGCFTDWWAMGILAYELMTGRSPWSTLEDCRQIRKEILTLEIQVPVRVPQTSINFIHSLLQRDHRERLGTKCDHEVLSSPFFQGVDWESIMRGETPPAFTPKAGELVVHRREAKEFLENYRQATAQQPAQDTESPLKEMRNLGLLQTTCGPPCISIHAETTHTVQSESLPLAVGGPSRFVQALPLAVGGPSRFVQGGSTPLARLTNSTDKNH